MVSSYEEVTNTEVAIRDLLSIFPDTLDLNETCQLLLEKVDQLNNDWSTSGAAQHISNFKLEIEKLETIIIELTSCIDELKNNTVEVTGYETIIESQVYY